MQKIKKNPFIRFVLFTNGVVDLVVSAVLFFPLFNLPLPGYELLYAFAGICCRRMGNCRPHLWCRQDLGLPIKPKSIGSW